MSRLARAELSRDGDRLLVIAGERGAVELRMTSGYCCFYAHSPVWLPELARHLACPGRGRSVPLSLHGCHLLEGECWTGLITSCGNYDFDRPDVDDVPQWDALEDLYRITLEGRRLWGDHRELRHEAAAERGRAAAGAG